MATDFLVGPMSSMFGRNAKPIPATKVVAIFGGIEQDITKDRNGLWGVRFEGERYQNSKLGDIIRQIEAFGGTVERRQV